ncbi:hypothetical protein [Mycobacteroides salmoniphilum]|uniref:hypothetical protein n=1 Tax=Mycobacteroides salmoniphilum TaxID=404941 RepID=UPI001F23AA66|nr:hypothetical protein [Mycobacteroides salmoniphilum]
MWSAWDWGNGRRVPWDRDPQPPPSAFIDRTPLPSCGSYTFGFRDRAAPAPQRDCMNNGRASGLGAELKIVQPTTEGDPVTTYYRVFSPQQRVEVFVDYSGDQFSNFGWSHFFCWTTPIDYSPDPSCPDPKLQPDR